MRNLFFIAGLLVVLLQACKDDDKLSNIEVFLPANFPKPVYDLAANPVTPEGFELGRRLFYDPILSRDNSISCGDCHQQSYAFTQHGHDVSHGIDDRLGRRNSLAVQNMIWHTNFFWDGGVGHLDLVPINAITNPDEMDESTAHVLEKLRAHKEYPLRFQRAFGSPEISSKHFLQALSQFMATLVSANSRYDKYVRKEAGGVLDAEELAGLDLFKTHCASCHSTDLFSDFRFHNNGLDASFDRDAGRYEASLIESDRGKFRTPSLRNLTASAPYMHDGRFETLDQVLRHYAEGVKDSPTLDPRLRQADGSLGIPLSADEQRKIIAFLRTLDDEQFLRDRRFSER